MKSKITPQKLRSKILFETLLAWASLDPKIPRHILKAVDVIAEYAGKDIAKGRKK